MSPTFQPFQEEHQIFRKQVRAFAENELAPHVDQWEEEKLFPNSVFKRAGELGILGAHYPEEVGGGGGDFWMSVVKSEELARCGSAGALARNPSWRARPMSLPRSSLFSPLEAKAVSAGSYHQPATVNGLLPPLQCSEPVGASGQGGE